MSQRLDLDNYVSPMIRVKEFRTDNKDKKVLVNTEVTNISFDKEAALVKATLIVDGNVVAVGHAMATELGEYKGLEKAETAAVGRALAFLGYDAEDTSGDAKETTKIEKKPSKGLGLGGLGKKGKTTPASKVEEESEEEETEEASTTAEATEETEDEDSQEEEVAAAPTPIRKPDSKSAVNGKLGDIMNKYKLGGKK